MPFKTFIGESGLKVLAMTRLNQCEHSIILYLLNCSASGLDEFITTERELSSLIGQNRQTLQEAITSLLDKNMIHLRHGENHGQPTDRQSLRIGLNYDIGSWHINFDEDVSTQDAVVFPFRRGSTLQLVNGEKDSRYGGSASTGKSAATQPTWQRVLESFVLCRNLDDQELEKAERDAKVLVETHPVDQVLLMLRHFKQRVPTLSLLASSWQHYQEVFEAETQKVDLLDARQKHVEADNKLREQVESVLGQKDELKLTDEEITVLEILYSHRHPRRQLFWAYQSRSRYPNLRSFFDENAKDMLPVTSTGVVVKKKPHQD